MLADGNALQLQIAVLLQHGNQRQVGGAAANVHHQQHVAAAHFFAPRAAAALNPAVQRSLGLLQQRQLREARCLCGLRRQFTCSGVERGRNGDGDVLRRQRILGVLRVPRGAQVAQVARRGFQRRDARHFGRCFGGQQGAAAVNTGMAQPAFGAGDQPNRRRCAACAGKFADGKVLGC